MIDVVLHPEFPPGVDDVLGAMGDVNLIRPSNDDDVAEALADRAPVLVTLTWKPEFLQPRLRWIAGLGAGVDQYPQDQLCGHGIVLTTAQGLQATCVAEHAFGLLLGLTRGLAQAVTNSSSGIWQSYEGFELEGGRMAILGQGRIGEEIAKRARAFGMDVIGIKRDTTDYSGHASQVVGPEHIIDVCEWANVLVVSAPANNDTRHAVSRSQLSALGAGWLVNVGRGSVVDEEALVEALTKGALLGAGLDVFGAEPLSPGSPLWGSPNVLITCHSASRSPRFSRRWANQFIHNLSALGGETSWLNRSC
jgi:D-2-hydroxyacid dehydrogenase (NADP+)